MTKICKYGIGKMFKWLGPNLRYSSGTFLEWLRKTTKYSDRMSGLYARIWTEDLLNMMQGCYKLGHDIQYLLAAEPHGSFVYMISVPTVHNNALTSVPTAYSNGLASVPRVYGNGRFVLIVYWQWTGLKVIHLHFAFKYAVCPIFLFLVSIFWLVILTLLYWDLMSCILLSTFVVWVSTTDNFSCRHSLCSFFFSEWFFLWIPSISPCFIFLIVHKCCRISLLHFISINKSQKVRMVKNKVNAQVSEQKML